MTMTRRDVEGLLIDGTGHWGSGSQPRKGWWPRDVSVGLWYFKWKYRLTDKKVYVVTAESERGVKKEFRDIGSLTAFYNEVCPTVVKAAYDGSYGSTKQIRIRIGRHEMFIGNMNDRPNRLYVGFADYNNPNYGGTVQKLYATYHEDAVLTFNKVDYEEGMGYRGGSLDYTEVCPMLDALIESDLDDEVKAKIEFFVMNRNAVAV